MTPRSRLARIRVALIAMVALTATAWAACGAVLAQVALRAAGVTAAFPFSIGAGLCILAALLWRYRAVRSLQSLALWVEEEEPDAAFALVTLVDSPGDSPPALIEAAAAADIEGRAQAAVHRLTAHALTAAAVAGTLWFAVGRNLTARETANAPATVPADAPSRLTPLTITVTPPRYTHLAPQVLANPQSIDALAGSAIEVAGRGSAEGVGATAGDSALPLTASGDRWIARLVMPAAPGVIKLADRHFSRLLVLAPSIDSVPEVVLRSPVHDTTYRVLPTEPIRLDARARDDFGLAVGYFEYLITVGGDENFTTVTRTSARQSLGDGHDATLQGSFRLDTLHLTPGSVVSVRAVVFDGNDVTGPGKGFSETRTLRLAERQDSSAVTAAPPDQVDSMLISQRLLNMKTDSLIKARHGMKRKDVADRSMTHSNTQESIRQRVLTVIGVIEDDGLGGTAPTDVSKLLRTAADEMAPARIELALASPTTAMPHMKKALAILDQVRLANRYYLRGRQPVQLVDLDKVRLKGQGSATPSPRLPRTALADALGRLSQRIETAARVYGTSPDGGRDSLTLIRVSALTLAPPVARELGSALSALEQGIPIDSALAPVRRVLAPAPESLAGPADWAEAPR